MKRYFVVKFSLSSVFSPVKKKKKSCRRMISASESPGFRTPLIPSQPVSHSGRLAVTQPADALRAGKVSMN